MSRTLHFAIVVTLPLLLVAFMVPDSKSNTKRAIDEEERGGLNCYQFCTGRICDFDINFSKWKLYGMKEVTCAFGQGCARVWSTDLLVGACEKYESCNNLTSSSGIPVFCTWCKTDLCNGNQEESKNNDGDDDDDHYSDELVLRFSPGVVGGGKDTTRGPAASDDGGRATTNTTGNDDVYTSDEDTPPDWEQLGVHNNESDGIHDVAEAVEHLEEMSMARNQGVSSVQLPAKVMVTIFMTAAIVVIRTMMI